MKKIGLTGGIASGKSTVLSFFKKRSIPYVDADVIAREVVEPGMKGLEAIVEHFGSTVLHKDGTLNREILGNIVFHDNSKRDVLNHCLKQYIRARIMELTEEYEAKRVPVLIYDIPLLIEGEWYTMMDEVWLVYVNETTQVQRLMARNGYSRSDAMARIHSQMKLDDKRPYATIIIDNNGAPHELEKQLQSIWSTRIEPVLKPFE